MHNDSLQDVLARSASAFAERTALVWNDQRLTYAELELKTNRLANYLLSTGVPRGSIIAVAIDDRVKLIESVIAILKAGCAFAPLDLNNPDKRLRSMIQGIEPFLSIVEAKLHGKLSALFPDGDSRFLIIDAKDDGEAANNAYPKGVWRYDGSGNAESPHVETSPDDICYIYFTSGSTGTPKAIAGRLKSLLHFVQWEINKLGVTEDFRTSQLVTPTFDAFLRDIFVPLCAGATICIPENSDIVLDPVRLIEWFDDEGITLVHCVPAIFRSLVRQKLDPHRLNSLKYIVMAGERLYPSEIERWMEAYGERIQLVNLYGATENTMAKFCHFIERADTERKSIPIGRPIEGAKAIILDANGNLCDPGVAGEIYIRTPFLTHGYYRNPELTAKVFVPNPLSAKPNDVIHRTGDFGRQLSDGNYELIGRKDHQVKIRGQRVELGEIESVIKENAAIHECVAVVWGEDEDTQRLVAYVVASAEAEPNVSGLRQIARDHLPEHMVPTSFVLLESLPLLPNGKIDRKALPPPDESRLLPADSYVAPTNEMEETLANIWSQILRIERVGIHDDFFQLGGHSLLATQVMSRVSHEFHVEVPLRELFESPDIANLAKLIEQERTAQREREETQILAMVENLSEEELGALLLLEQMPGEDENTGSPDPQLQDSNTVSGL